MAASFISIPPAFILYGIALFSWGLIELDAALKRRKGVNVEEGLSIATNLDVRISKRWLAIIILANGLVSLLASPRLKVFFMETWVTSAVTRG